MVIELQTRLGLHLRLSGCRMPEDIRLDVQKHLEHCEICSAILDSTRNIIILTADERVFELPVGFSERLHARIDLELQGTGGGYNNEPCRTWCARISATTRKRVRIESTI
jgi:hypothetical protein